MNYFMYQFCIALRGYLYCIENGHRAQDTVSLCLDELYSNFSKIGKQENCSMRMILKQIKLLFSL